MSRNGEGPGYRVRGATTGIEEAARTLRRRMTPAERDLWQALRAKRLQGLDFRRQHPVGQFILDFYCPVHRLVIEVDGGVHDALAQRQRDQARTEQLQKYGYRVLRFSNAEIIGNLEDALRRILNEIAGSGTTTTP